MSGAAPGPIRLLLLVGMMGAGKSVVGRAAADSLGWTYLDNDDLVRDSAGVEPAAVAATSGVAVLHELERAALDVVLAYPGPLVASAASSVVDESGRFERRTAGVLVAWLRARPETLRARIADGAGRRADALSETWLAETAREREVAFAAVADLIVDVDDATVAEVAALLVAEVTALLVAEARARP